MDDIAGYCGISKKTIYVFFDSKEKLIIEIVKTILAESSECLTIISATASDVLFEMNNLLEHLQKTVMILTPSFIREVKKYYPAAYDLFVEFREKTILPFVTQNIIIGSLPPNDFRHCCVTLYLFLNSFTFLLWHVEQFAANLNIRCKNDASKKQIVYVIQQVICL